MVSLSPGNERSVDRRNASISHDSSAHQFDIESVAMIAGNFVEFRRISVSMNFRSRKSVVLCVFVGVGEIETRWL